MGRALPCMHRTCAQGPRNHVKPSVVAHFVTPRAPVETWEMGAGEFPEGRGSVSLVRAVPNSRRLYLKRDKKAKLDTEDFPRPPHAC